MVEVHLVGSAPLLQLALALLHFRLQRFVCFTQSNIFEVFSSVCENDFHEANQIHSYCSVRVIDIPQWRSQDRTLVHDVVDVNIP